MMKLDASSKIISVKFGDEEKVISGRACTAWKIATGYESYGATARYENGRLRDVNTYTINNITGFS